MTGRARAVELRGFARVPAQLLTSGLSDRAVRVWAVLAARQAGHQEAWMSHTDLAALLPGRTGPGSSTDAVQRAIAQLEERGWVEVRRRAGRGAQNAYRVLGLPPIDHLPAGSRSEAATEHVSSRSRAARGSRSDAATGATGSRSRAASVAAPERLLVDRRVDRTTTTTSTVTARGSDAAADPGGGGGELAPSQALTALRAVAPDAVRRSWATVALQVATPLRRAAARGWTTSSIADALAGTDTARDPCAAYIARARALADQPAPDPETAHTSPRTTPGCQRCHAGWLGEDSDGRPIPCPSCRPAVAQRPAIHTPAEEKTL